MLELEKVCATLAVFLSVVLSASCHRSGLPNTKAEPTRSDPTQAGATPDKPQDKPAPLISVPALPKDHIAAHYPPMIRL